MVIFSQKWECSVQRLLQMQSYFDTLPLEEISLLIRGSEAPLAADLISDVSRLTCSPSVREVGQFFVFSLSPF